MGNELKLNSAEEAEVVLIRLTPEEYPIAYANKVNTLSFNWNDYGGKITQEEFDDFVNNVDRSQLPEGIKFELK